MRANIACTAIVNNLCAKMPKTPDADWGVWSRKMWTSLLSIIKLDSIHDPQQPDNIINIVGIKNKKEIEAAKIDKCVMLDGCFIFFDDARQNIIVINWDSTDIQKLCMKVPDLFNSDNNLENKVHMNRSAEVRVVNSRIKR